MLISIMANQLIRTTISHIARQQRRPLCWKFNNNRRVLCLDGGIRCSSTQSATATTHTAPLSSDVQREIDHHAKMADKWWDPNGQTRALHSLNALRVPFVRDGIVTRGNVAPELIGTTSVLKDQKILEIGCGGGILTEQLARLGANITALDLGADLIHVARDHLSKMADPKLCDRIQYKIESVETHAKDKQQFYDAVVISEVLEHIDDKIGFLTSSVQCLRPGGSVFITTLSKTFPMWFCGIVLGEYVLKIAPIGTHHYEKMITPLECQRILDTMGCHTVLVNGSVYEFWNNKWKWINSTNLCYALQAVKTEI